MAIALNTIHLSIHGEQVYRKLSRHSVILKSLEWSVSQNVLISKTVFSMIAFIYNVRNYPFSPILLITQLKINISSTRFDADYIK